MYEYPKDFLSVPQLIRKLQDTGMIIDSEDNAINTLTTIGYYRLRGYSFHLIDPDTQKYVQNTKLSDVLKLYCFDSDLSHLIFKFLSKIEIALRARLVNAFQSKGDSLILNDPSAFFDKNKYWRNQGSVASEIARSNDVFIKHNFDNHDGAVPIWASVEVMSFGTLSKIIKNLKTGDESVFSILVQDYRFKNENENLINPSKNMFTSWIHTVSIMRNICAHNGRIYNRSTSTRPSLISADRLNPQPRYNGLYEVMLSMKYLRPSDTSWLEFVDEFKDLLVEYSGVYEIARMNFPNDWVNHFQI